MKKLLITTGLMLVSSAAVFADIARNDGELVALAGWDFNGGNASTVASVNARYSLSQGASASSYFTAGVASSPGAAAYGSVSFTAAGGGSFASNRALGSGLEAPAYQLQGVGLTNPSNDALGEVTTNARAIALSSNTVLDSGRAAFKFSTLSDFNVFEDISLSFAARNQGTGTSTIGWSYSLDGVNFTSLAGSANSFTNSPSYSRFDISFASIDALEGKADVWIGLDYSEDVLGAATLLDNVAFYGTAAAIPEPSTYAAILGAVSLGFVMIRRRFQAKAA